MALVNHAKKEINAKIVYYGPPGSGKNTALTYIYSRIKPSLRGDLRNVPAGADNLLFFDFSPFETPLPNGYHVRLHIYTLTGIVANPATWKMTLKGTDGIIIMVNPATEHLLEAKESVSQLRDFLSAYGVGLHETPAVLQFNSFYNGNQPVDVADNAAALDLSPLAICHSNADTGEGLLEALTTLSRQVLDQVTIKNKPSDAKIAISDIPPDFDDEKCEPVQEVVSVRSEVVPHALGSLHVTLLSNDVAAENGAIRIPLEIVLGEERRRITVTVNIELE